jgi:DNA-binding CsgD family transcriptional regulator
VTFGDRHLIGRHGELQALAGLLDAPEDLPRAAVLAGTAGIGKTTLWLAACEAAEERGYRVLSSRPAETETGFSFAGLGDLIGDTLDETLPELPGPQRRALEQALLLDDSADGPADEQAIALAFLNTLRGLAAERLVVAVDDVQWLDAPSLAALRFALGRLRHEPVAACVTTRGAVPSWIRRALGDERLLEIEVGPLSVGALHEVLRKRVGMPLSRPTLLRLWETSGGNPFFALELARALERRGGSIELTDELPIPDDLDELVAERLEALTAPAQEVARVVALLAEPTTDLLDEAVDASESAGLADALDAGILELDGDRIRFSHPLLASALVSRTPPDFRRELHARLATVVEDDEERARHLAFAATGPDSAVAEVLEAASKRARSRGASTAAAELAEHTLRLTPRGDAELIRSRAVEAGDRVYEAGDSRRAIFLLEEALGGLPTGPERAAIVRRLAAARSAATGPRDGVSLYREALAQSGGDDALEAEIHLELANTLRFTTGMADAEPHAEAAVRAAERIGDDSLLCRALTVFGLIHFKLGRGIPDDVMRRAIALEESLAIPTGMWTPKGVLCDQLFWSHDIAAARSLSEELLEAARRREDIRIEAELLWYLAMIEWRAGNWGRAAAVADETIAQHEQGGDEGVSPVTEWPRTLIAAHRGLVDDARRWAEAALTRADDAGINTARAGHLWVIGFIELSLGRPEPALPWLEQAHELRRSVGHGEPGQYWELPDLVDTLLALGELEQVEAAIAPLEERGRVLDRPWALAIAARTRALILAARGDLPGALHVFERALAEHRRTEDPFQLARSALALGSTQRRAKQRRAARETLRRALTLFEDVGAPLWAAQARAELGRISGRAPSPDELTPSERRVAALVAEGRTNREVAAALFVGERTVESHLTHIYAKLGVRSRTELATRLH